MSKSSMRVRLVRAVRSSTSWGGGAFVSETQAAAIVDALLVKLREPDEAMTAAGGEEGVRIFAAMIDVVLGDKMSKVGADADSPS